MYYFLSITGSAAALAATGFLYQWLGAHYDRMRYAGVDGGSISETDAGCTCWKRDRATSQCCLNRGLQPPI